MRQRADALAPTAILAVLCLASLFLRPLLPPDETRYLTVAWEMLLQKSVFVPTLNFLPYHHKPPLLFWLIDLVWSVAGVSRAGAMLVVFLISSALLHLTGRLARALFPDREDIARRAPWLMLGSVVFTAYSSLVLFDFLLTAIVVAAFLAFHRFARDGRRRWAVAAGLLVGLGVLAKGPVVLIHIGWPLALYPLWRASGMISVARLWRGIALAFAAALLPVALWLVPAGLSTSGDFVYNLVWKQSAGRISGQMEASHPRPFTFYLLLLPVALLPWGASPALWRTRPITRVIALRQRGSRDYRNLRLLALWATGIVATFSLISGKQPHYIAPILPLVTVAFAFLMDRVDLRAIRVAATLVVAVAITGQAIAAVVWFPRLDVAPGIATLTDAPDAPLAFVGFYQGELGFLARRTAPVERIEPEAMADWLNRHPTGAIVDTSQSPPPPGAQAIHSHAYREGRLTVYRLEPQG